MNRGVHISRESGYTQAEIIALIRGELEKQNDKNFPVGYIWMSTVDTDPSTIVGGTWERIQDTFLLAAGSAYTAGDTGGEATHTLIESELPNVTGSAIAMNYWGGSAAEAVYSAGGAFSATPHTNEEYLSPAGWASGIGGRRPGTLNLNFGSNGAHNNMPPYLTVYMWERTG